jgi:hypothetical protein
VSRGPRYFEVDVDVSSSSVAANIVGLVQGLTKSLCVDMAICLEGHSPEELPESLLGTVRCSHLDLNSAKLLDTTTGARFFFHPLEKFSATERKHVSASFWVNETKRVWTSLQKEVINYLCHSESTSAGNFRVDSKVEQSRLTSAYCTSASKLDSLLINSDSLQQTRMVPLLFLYNRTSEGKTLRPGWLQLVARLGVDSWCCECRFPPSAVPQLLYLVVNARLSNGGL